MSSLKAEINTESSVSEDAHSSQMLFGQLFTEQTIVLIANAMYIISYFVYYDANNYIS